MLNSSNSLTHSIDDIYDYCWEYVAEPKTRYKGNQIITIDKAIEKYIIDNRKLDIAKFKTVKSVEDELFIKFEYHPINFFNKLIRNTCVLDGKNSGFWLPVVNITNKKSSIESQTININNNIYYIEEPKPEDIVCIDNIFNMNNDIGACSAHAGLFACESLEQAYHISKYFKYELFVAMYGNSPFINKYYKKQ